MKTFHGGKVTLHAGDCLDVLKALPENSVDAVVTDPPYHLTSIVKRFGAEGAKPTVDGVYSRSTRGFMGKQWDGGDIAFRPELWAEVLRVLKPGGHMVCFGGTRTYHRMTCAIEDAGFEIRDAIMWHYGSGFPKSHDVSKGIDRAAGMERHIVGSYSGATNVSNAGSGLRHDCYGIGGDKKTDSTVFVTAPATDAARQWQGWGTALKPSTEIIALCRKPLSEGTVAANVLRWGTGAINIDRCRVSLDASENVEKLNARSGGRRGFASEYVGGNDHPLPPCCDLSKGRWPANLCHDGSPEVLTGFPETATSERKLHHDIGRTYQSVYGEPAGAQYTNGNTHGDSGSAARFFYTAKADANDRLNSKHPTVKPVDLMQWLVRLVCPKGGTVLDPFAGTGTTGEAAFREGCRTVLIEREAEYLADIERRMGMLLSGTDERARKLATPDAHESLPLFALAGE